MDVKTYNLTKESNSDRNYALEIEKIMDEASVEAGDAIDIIFSSLFSEIDNVYYTYDVYYNSKECEENPAAEEVSLIIDLFAADRVSLFVSETKEHIADIEIEHNYPLLKNRSKEALTFTLISLGIGDYSGIQDEELRNYIRKRWNDKKFHE